jgi:hypothetical protein
MKDSGSIIKLAIMAAIAYFGYEYLVRSGLWAQWFGGAAQPQPQPTAGGIQTMPGYNPAQAALPAPIQPSPSPIQLSQPPASAISAAVQAQLQASANQYLANMQAAGTPKSGLDVDNWLYYYQVLVHGANPNNLSTFPITGAQAATVFNALGINYNDPTARVTPVTLPQFAAAMSRAGVSGVGAIIPVPNNGPISAPLPTQSFGAGYGGYGNGGYRKGNGYVQ